MQLHNADGSTFKLSIQGYQFPEIVDDFYDSNWLVITVEVTTPERSWQGSDPCLLTWELAELAKWLEHAAQNLPLDEAYGFIEPALLFRIHHRQAGETILRVVLNYALHPDWRTMSVGKLDECWIDFQVDSQALQHTAQALRQQLEQYPQRAER